MILLARYWYAAVWAFTVAVAVVMSSDPMSATKLRMNEVWISRFGAVNLADEEYQKFAEWSFKKVYSWRKPISTDILTKYFDQPSLELEVPAPSTKKFNTYVRESMQHVYPMFGMVDGRSTIKGDTKKEQFQELRTWIMSEVSVLLCYMYTICICMSEQKKQIHTHRSPRPTWRCLWWRSKRSSRG